MAARPRASRALIAWAAVAAVAAAPAPSAVQDPVFRAAVDTVRVDVSVTRGNQPVTGLTAGQFEVDDNGVPQTVTSATREDVPLRLLLALDTSSSLAGESLPALIDAASALVAALRPDDEVGLLTFDQRIRIAVAPTTAHDDVVAELRTLRAGGTTAWRDALFAALQLVGDGGTSRPVVLLFTDGADTASWIGAEHIVEAVRRSGVVVHGIGLEEPPGWLGDGSSRPIGRTGVSLSLRRAVAAGGGRRWEASSPRAISQLFATALDELRARYLITYSPAAPVTEGWHEVKVRVKGLRAEITARPGYFVAPK